MSLTNTLEDIITYNIIMKGHEARKEQQNAIVIPVYKKEKGNYIKIGEKRGDKYFYYEP